MGGIGDGPPVSRHTRQPRGGAKWPQPCPRVSSIFPIRPGPRAHYAVHLARSAWDQHTGHLSVTCGLSLTPASMMVLAVRRSVEPRQLPRPAPVTLDLLCLQSLGCLPGHWPGLHHQLASAGQPAVSRVLRGPALRVVGRADVGALSTGVVDRVGDHTPRGRPGASRTSCRSRPRPRSTTTPAASA